MIISFIGFWLIVIFSCFFYCFGVTTTLKAHKKSHHFRDTPSDICSCLYEPETTEHYITFAGEGKLLMDSITPLWTAKHLTIANDLKLICLLYGFKSFTTVENSKILIATLKYINGTAVLND